MEVASIEGEGLDENARQAFADLITRATGLIEEALYMRSVTDSAAPSAKVLGYKLRYELGYIDFIEARKDK